MVKKCVMWYVIFDWILIFIPTSYLLIVLKWLRTRQFQLNCCSAGSQVLCEGLCIFNRYSCFACDDLLPVQMCVCFNASMVHLLYSDFEGLVNSKTLPYKSSHNYIWVGDVKGSLTDTSPKSPSTTDFASFSLLCKSWLTKSVSLTPLAVSCWLFLV